MDNCTDLYYINRKMTSCDLFMCFLLMFAELGFALCVTGLMSPDAIDIAAGFTIFALAMWCLKTVDICRYHWLAVKDRII